MNFKAINKNIAIKPLEEETKVGNIIVTGTQNKYYYKGIVVSIGDKVEGITENSLVLFRSKYPLIEVNGEEIVVTTVEQILGTIN